jgi:hypothetical protein
LTSAGWNSSRSRLGHGGHFEVGQPGVAVEQRLVEAGRQGVLGRVEVALGQLCPGKTTTASLVCATGTSAMWSNSGGTLAELVDRRIILGLQAADVQGARRRPLICRQ